MSELITIARPYAKAAFDFAVENRNVAHWQSMLTFSAEVSRNEHIVELLSRVIACEKMAQEFIMVCGEALDTFGKNLICIMAENRRLSVLPEVLDQFILLRTEKEETIEIDIITASMLKADQLAKISTVMEQRLSYKVKLNCKIDNSVIAGIVIHAGDMVIDGSVRGRLERLSYILQS